MNKKKLWIGIAAFPGGAALLAVIAMGILFLLLKSREEAFKKGFTFEAEYRIVLQEQEEGFFSLFPTGEWKEGFLKGEMDGDILHFVLIPNGEEENTAEAYCGGGELLLNIRSIYEVQREKIAEQIPLVGRLLPEWPMGAYISTELLGEALGLELNPGFLMEASAWSSRDFTRIRYEEGKPGMQYFRLDTDAAAVEGYEIIAGIDRKTLFRGPLSCDVIIRKEQQYELTLTVTAWQDSDIELSMPEDVVEREDLEWLISLRKLIEMAAEIL